MYLVVNNNSPWWPKDAKNWPESRVAKFLMALIILQATNEPKMRIIILLPNLTSLRKEADPNGTGDQRRSIFLLLAKSFHDCSRREIIDSGMLSISRFCRCKRRYT